MCTTEPVKTKYCVKCKKHVPLTDFRVVDRKKGVRYTYCKPCTKLVNNAQNDGHRHLDLMKAKAEWLRKRAMEKPE